MASPSSKPSRRDAAAPGAVRRVGPSSVPRNTRARSGLVLRGALLFLVALALALADSVYRPVSVRFVPTVTEPLKAGTSGGSGAAGSLPTKGGPTDNGETPAPSPEPSSESAGHAANSGSPGEDPLKSRFAEIMIETPLAIDLFNHGTADGSPVDFIDARSAEHYAQGHVPGAYNLPPEAFQASKPALMDRLARDIPLIIYCDGGDCEASELVAVRLQEYRYEKLYILREGYPGWTAGGGPVKVGP